MARGCRRGPEEAALQVHLALHTLALGAHLDGALQLALKLAGGPWKGLLEDDHVVDDALLHPIRPQLQVGVARKALPSILAHQRALMGVYGYEFSPLEHWSERPPKRKLYCKVQLLFLSVGKKSVR